MNDSESKLLATVIAWFDNSAAVSLLASYLRGVRQRAGQIPDLASARLDEAAQNRPGDVLHVTLLSDWSERGLHRVMTVLPRVEADRRGMLRHLSFEPWAATLGVPEEQRLLEQFCVWAEAGDARASGIAIEIVAMWQHSSRSSLSAELAPVLIRLAKMAEPPEVAVADHDWKEVVEAVRVFAPKEAAELLAQAITDVKSQRYHRRKYAQELFCEVARDHPDVAMEAIGRWILDKERGPIFRLFEFKGLFDAIGFATVKPWVEKHREQAAISIARHLDGPRLDAGGSPVIPELADWLLTTFSHVPRVFREFAMGRHSGEVRVGHARSREAELEKRLKPFESYPREWVRRWVQYERDQHRAEVEWDDRRDEEDERT